MERACVDQGQGNTNSPDPRSTPTTTVGRGSTTNGDTIDYPCALLGTQVPRVHIHPSHTPPALSAPASTYINTISSSYTSLPSSCPPPSASSRPPSITITPLSDSWSRTSPRPQLDPSAQTSSLTDHPHHSYPLASSQPTTSVFATMSTAALHFDPGFNHFNMGGRSFAWPGMHTSPTPGSSLYENHRISNCRRRRP